MFTSIGGRKFIAFCLSLGVYCAIALYNKSAPDFMGIIGLFTAYAGANVASEFATKGKVDPVA